MSGLVSILAKLRPSCATNCATTGCATVEPLMGSLSSLNLLFTFWGKLEGEMGFFVQEMWVILPPNFRRPIISIEKID